MAIVEFTPTPEQYVWTFGGAEPVMEVAPGTVLKLWTEDAFAGRVTSSADKPSEVLNPKELNPQTGPFYVTGAEPGDTLALHVVSLEPARDWAASTTIPLFGALTGTDRTAGLQPPLPELTWIYQIDRAAGHATFVAHETDFTMTMPLAPMLGTVGVAPALREVRTTLVPDYFGGNMDTPELRAGTTVYLGVNVEGALFSVGDGHYRQGEGETCGTALEGAMNVTIIVDLIIPQAIAKWALLAPIFIPLFIRLNVAPQTVLAAYRVGDSPGNVLTPLMAYFPLIVIFTQRYKKDAGIGTVVSLMLPYFVILSIAWTLFFVAWYLLGIPWGPGAPVHP
jgi:acetamidase/formamidase